MTKSTTAWALLAYSVWVLAGTIGAVNGSRWMVGMAIVQGGLGLLLSSGYYAAYLYERGQKR